MVGLQSSSESDRLRFTLIYSSSHPDVVVCMSTDLLCSLHAKVPVDKIPSPDSGQHKQSERTRADAALNIREIHLHLALTLP